MEYEIKTNVEIQIFDDEAVLLDLDTGNYYGLNNVSNDIWTNLTNGVPLRDILNIILDDYDEDSKKINNDFNLFINDLIKYELLAIKKSR